MMNELIMHFDDTIIIIIITILNDILLEPPARSLGTGWTGT